MKISAIYKIESKLNPKKIYIGSAVNTGQRWINHLCDLRKNKHINGRLQNHYNKYGEADLQFSILLGCEKEDLLKTEQYFIDSYNPFFNICRIAGSRMGTKQSDETRKKMSITRKGKPNTPEHNINIGKSKIGKHTGIIPKRAWVKGSIPWNKGKTGVYSEETKAKMSESQKKRFESKDERLKMSMSFMGRIPWNKGIKGEDNPNFGMIRSAESKKKMSESVKMFYKSEDGIKILKRRKDLVIPTISEETRQKMRDAWVVRKLKKVS